MNENNQPQSQQTPSESTQYANQISEIWTDEWRKIKAAFEAGQSYKPSSESSHSPTEQPGDAKHTPGRWKFRHHETGADEIYTGDREATIALVYSGGVWASDVGLNDKNAVKYANAELIARAPEMAAELEQLRSERDKMREALEAEQSKIRKLNNVLMSIDNRITKAINPDSFLGTVSSILDEHRELYWSYDPSDDQ